MLRQKLSEHSFVVQLLSASLGILVIVIGFALFDNKTVLALVEGIGGALIIASLVAVFQGLFGVDVLTQIEHRLRLAIRVQEMGLTAIHAHIGDESIFDKFEHAQSIAVMYNTAKNTTYRYLGVIRQAILERGCTVRFVIADPSNPALQIKQVYDSLCPGTNIINEINDVVQRVSMMVEELQQSSPPPKAGSFEIRYYPCLPPGA